MRRQPDSEAGRGSDARFGERARARDRNLKAASLLCEQRGSNLTPLRKHVLGLLLMAPKPAKAYDILPNVKSSGRAVPATLYRALDFLLETRLAHRIVSLDAYVACSHPASCVDPFFLICQGCGRASELAGGPGLAKLRDEAAELNFAAHEALIEISGYCRLCTSV